MSWRADITSHVDVPGFDRAMMDGFALAAAQTVGATAYHPVTLDVVGEILPASTAEIRLQSGQAVRIMTDIADPRRRRRRVTRGKNPAVRRPGARAGRDPSAKEHRASRRGRTTR